jgi:phospholipid/cholesterol/gamma-HCH transport system permease protein
MTIDPAPAASSPSPRYSIRHSSVHDGVSALRIQGRLTLLEAAPLWAELDRHALSASRGETLDFDMSEVEQVDGSAMALLAHLRTRLQQRGVKAEFTGASSGVQQIISLYKGDVEVGRRKRRRAKGSLDQIGQATLLIVAEIQQVLAFIGYLVLEGLRVLKKPRSANWQDLPYMLERTGADAVPIVALIEFLVGIVMAFQSSNQLKQYGADIFLADLIGISMTRELGPLLTAIVVCGRSGAAFAAELGTMKVNEEIDALRTMGFGPMRYLVLPRLIALTLVMPLLTLLADLLGIIGGMVVAAGNLDIAPTAFLTEVQSAVRLGDLFTGLYKAAVFGSAIALIACQQGLATSGGAEGVGRRTTSAVVTTLFVLVILDAVFTIFFEATGL